MARTGLQKNRSLVSAIAGLKEELAIDIVRERLAAREDPIDLIAESKEAMRQVGENYENGKYYLSGLIMGGEIFREVTSLIRPAFVDQIRGNSRGVVLLGTVEGDIHDLGKNVVKILLNCHKFDVHDLGVDIPAGEFLIKAREINPDIIGLSGILTYAFDSMRKTVNDLKRDGILAPIIIGGPQINEEVRRYTGADYWVNDATAGINICNRLVEKRG